MCLFVTIQNRPRFEFLMANLAGWDFFRCFLQRVTSVSFINWFNEVFWVSCVDKRRLKIRTFTSCVFMCIFSIPGPLKLLKHIWHCGCFLQLAYKRIKNLRLVLTGRLRYPRWAMPYLDPIWMRFHVTLKPFAVFKFLTTQIAHK